MKPNQPCSQNRKWRLCSCLAVCALGIGASAYAQNFRSTLVLAPYSLSFGDVLVGKTTDAQTITLLNTGAVPAQIDKITITGPFSQTNNCPVPPATLGENQTCGIEVIFQPWEPTRASGNVSVFHDGRADPFVVALAGAGTLDASLVKFSPPSLDFGGEKMGAVSPAQTTTLTNAGQKALFISKIATEGDFTIAPSSTCEKLTNALAPGASCTLVVTFTPLGTGPRTGAVVVSDDAEDSPQRIRLSGTGQER